MIPLFDNESETLPLILQKFDKTEKSLNQDVDILQKWMRTQPHLPEIMETKMIKFFLLTNKFSIEKTKCKIDNYYTIKGQLRDIYENISPELPQMKEVLDIVYMGLHPKLHDKLYRVFFAKPRNKNLLPKLDLHNVVRLIFNIQEMRARHDLSFGGVFVMDLDGVDFSCAMKMTPSLLFKVSRIHEEVFSSQLKGLYMLNFPPFCEKIITLAKTVMKPKLLQRVHICKNVSDLKQHFDEEFLPTDFGGTGPSLDELQENLKNMFRSCKDLFEHLEDLRVDESLRPETIRNDEILGFQGTFKKLQID